MKSAFILLLPLTVACSPGQKDPGGTAVGNPGEARMKMSDQNGITWRSATARIDTLIVVDCAGAEEVIEAGDEFSLLGDETIEVPEGDYCDAILTLDGMLTLEGTADNGIEFTMTTALPDDEIVIYSDNAFHIEENQTIFELGSSDMLSVEALDLVEAEENNIPSTAPVAQDFGGHIATTSALWLDRDEDGDIDDGERSKGPLASGDSWEPDEDTDGGGCSSDGDEGWLLLFLTPFLFRRPRKPVAKSVK